MKSKILLNLFILTLLLSGLIASQELFRNTLANSRPNTISTTNLPVDVENLILDKETVFSWCPSPLSSNYCSKDRMNIKVKTLVKQANSDDLTYYYGVSSGQIIEEGANVTWNLTESRPGKHTIVVGVGSDYIIRGRTIAKTIEIVECDICDIGCSCPSLSVLSSSKPANPGDTFIFAALVCGAIDKVISYKWSVSNGIIVNGQGTSHLIVKTNADAPDGNITATVEIGGTDVACNCITTADRTVQIESSKQKH